MDITIGDAVYRTGKLDAFKQFHIARRLAPVIFAMGTTVKDVLKSGKSIEALSDIDAVMALGPAAEIISRMSDADADYVLNTCLAVCSRQQGDNKWALVKPPGAGIMFQDITLPVMMRLAVAVIQENVGNFFPDQQEESPAKR